MATDKKSLSFGRYLQAIRLEKGIDLETVSKKTKIGIENLILIEKEDHGSLPPEIFVKGFLRAYAKAIGADGDEAVQRYLASLNIFQKTVKMESDLIKSSTKFWPRLLLSLGTLLCIIALSVFGISIFQDQSSNDDQFEQTINENNHDIASKAPYIPEPVTKPSEDISKKLLLKITTAEETWIKIIVDEQNPKEYSLKPGERLEMEASSGYNLLIGNAAGVELTLNGKPIEVWGERGQVINVQIP